MTYEEKGTWVSLLVGVLVYAAYLLSLGITGGSTRLLLWSVGASIVFSIIARIALEHFRPSETRRADQRDRDIARNGFFAGYWVLVVAALGALVLALDERSHFVIANVLYFGFFASSLVGWSVRLIAYRRGF